MTIRRYLIAPPQGGGGGGAVDSVNGQTGAVVLDAADVGADPAGTAEDAVGALNTVTVVENGATTGTARPPVPRVLWLGSVRPTNMIAGDIYFQVSTVPVGFSPLDLPGLLAWYDASQLELADGATVTALPDLSSNGRDMVPLRGTVTFDIDGLNGTPALSLTGLTSLYTPAGLPAAPRTTLVAFSAAGAAGQTQRVLSARTVGAAQGLNLFIRSTTNQWGASGDNLAGFAGGTADTSPHIAQITINGASSSIVIDGGTPITGSTGAFDFSEFSIGPHDPAHNMNGKVAGVIVCSGVLGPEDAAAALEFLQGHHGFA